MDTDKERNYDGLSGTEAPRTCDISAKTEKVLGKLGTVVILDTGGWRISELEDEADKLT